MKRIVICCDGTWNKPDQPSPTNVVKVAITLKMVSNDGAEQILYYDQGVGTGTFDRIRGGAFGVGLSRNIQEAYRFLVFNYEPGDELFFFGFSRGAYTVRSAVGLIRNSGLLKREHFDKVEAAYQLYRRRDKESGPAEAEATDFRDKYAHQPRVKFIGVWDTVGALGIPLDGPMALANKFWEFHDLRLSRSVDYAYHALAIDEKRKPFRPTLWEQHPEAHASQVLEQVWFTGVHSNVGGGYPDTGLSDIALLWMVGKAEACGLSFNRGYLLNMVKPDALAKLENSQNLFYKIIGFGDFQRRLGPDPKRSPAPVTKETVASTAGERLENSASNYKAKNLREFLKNGGKQTPVP
jgi:uncharacterized protein (DUF2235 family)